MINQNYLLKLLFVSIFLVNISCSNDSNDLPNMDPTSRTISIEEFESEYVKNFYDTIPSASNSIKLIGFKTIPIEKDQRKEFLEYLQTNAKEMNQNNNHYYSGDGSFIRVYFPLNEAIIEYNGTNHEADENGVVNYVKNSKMTNNDNDVVIIGRKKSEFIAGTGSNIITPDKIILGNPLTTKSTVKTNKSIYVYDLGIREFHEENHGENLNIEPKSGRKVSCYNNHRKRNCTTAFGYHGRCSKQKVTCLDYNGWITDCKKYGKTHWKRYRNFAGSDCDYAMRRGHCWNEL